MGKDGSNYITKNDLRQSLRELYRNLRKDLRADIHNDMYELLDKQSDLFRDELDSKLFALETKLKTHTEEVVGSHSPGLLENIASVIDPRGTGLKGRKLPRFQET